MIPRDIIVKTRRTELRPLRDSDAVSLADNANNINVWKNVRDIFPHPYTENDARDFIAYTRSKAQPEELAIIIDGQAAGMVGIVPQKDVERYNAEIGYWLGEPYWNRGILTEVLSVFIPLIFENTEIQRLFAPVYAHNAASARVLEKAGFRRVGELQRAAFKNGTFIDMYLYELLKQKK